MSQKESSDEYIARFNREMADRATNDSAKRYAFGQRAETANEIAARQAAQSNSMRNIDSQRMSYDMANQRDKTVFTQVWTQKVSWTNIIGDVEEVEARGETLHEAIQRAYTMAEARGWTPKKWWMFWRWQDTPDLRKTLKFYGQ